MKFDLRRAATLAELRAFLAGAAGHDFEPVSRAKPTASSGSCCGAFPTTAWGRADRGVVLGLPAAGHRIFAGAGHAADRAAPGDRDLRDRRGAAKPFARKYTDADVRLLADTDRLHEDLSAPAVRHLCRRQYEVYGDRRYERLAGISSSHLHNLRQRPLYRSRRRRVAKTQPVMRAIGERRRPSRTDSPDTCGWTPCTRATASTCTARRGKRACIS